MPKSKIYGWLFHRACFNNWIIRYEWSSAMTTSRIQPLLAIPPSSNLSLKIHKQEHKDGKMCEHMLENMQIWPLRTCMTIFFAHHASITLCTSRDWHVSCSIAKVWLKLKSFKSSTLSKLTIGQGVEVANKVERLWVKVLAAKALVFALTISSREAQATHAQLGLLKLCLLWNQLIDPLVCTMLPESKFMSLTYIPKHGASIAPPQTLMLDFQDTKNGDWLGSLGLENSYWQHQHEMLFPS